MTAAETLMFVRAKDFHKVFGIPDSTRTDWENPESDRYDPTFPKKYRMGRRYTAYSYAEVMAWLASRQEK